MITPVATLLTNTLGAGGGTTDPLDTSGANLIVISVSYFSALSATPEVSDSNANTWHALEPAAENDNGHRFFYALGTAISVGPGHTFTVVNAGVADIHPAVFIHAFGGVKVFYGFTRANTNNPPGPSVTSIQPGSLTPPENGALFITGLSVTDFDPVPPAVDSGMTLNYLDALSGNVAGATGYVIQTLAAALNPTWSWAPASKASTSLAVFSEQVIRVGNGVPCCASESPPGGPGPEGGFGWIPQCGGGGLAPDGTDVSNSEDWSVL